MDPRSVFAFSPPMPPYPVAKDPETGPNRTCTNYMPSLNKHRIQAPFNKTDFLDRSIAGCHRPSQIAVLKKLKKDLGPYFSNLIAITRQLSFLFLVGLPPVAYQASRVAGFLLASHLVSRSFFLFRGISV